MLSKFERGDNRIVLGPAGIEDTGDFPRDVLVCRAEVERVASHAAFLAQGRLLMTGTLEELRQRLVLVRMRCESPQDLTGLGRVVDEERSGRQWQAVLLDADRTALQSLVHREGITEYTEAALNLEEMYRL